MSMIVWRLEMQKTWRHPLLGGLGALALTFLSLLFYRLCVDYLQLANDTVLQSQRTISVSLEIVKPFCSWSMVLFSFIIPLLSTASISQEFRQNTFLLWATSSFSAFQIVIGKWFSMVSMIMGALAMMFLMIATLSLETKLDYGLIFSALCAVALVSSCFISFGLFISSLIPFPLFAMGVSFIGNILWIVLEWFDPFPAKWHFLSEQLSLFGHLDHFLNGILTSADIGYYLAFSGVWLGLTMMVMHQKMIKVSQ
jgi:ABC-2 type transport system permease protein